MHTGMNLFDDTCGGVNPELSLREVPLSSPYYRKQIENFLVKCGLTPPARLDYMVAIYDDDERLWACCGLDVCTIKCLAVDPEARNMNLAGRLVNHMTDCAWRKGHSNVSVFTKPGNLDLFTSMGFHLVGRALEAIMLESDPKALKRYTDYLRTLRRPGPAGAIVMNGNPMTQGHLYLIEQARQRIDHLYVIIVADNPLTFFSYADRKAMLQETLKPFDNVTLVEGSIYSVSAATFPSYFIKKKTQATEAHIALDLDIFGRHLGPALGVTHRFVGEEPLDPLTAAYNEGMHRLLPGYGIEVVEIPRCRIDNSPASPVICATRVRESLHKGDTTDALRISTPATKPYLLAKAAVQAMQDELDLTPKPGLVDRANAGAHSDMDYDLMNRSLHVLEAPLKEVALLAYRDELPATEELRTIGCDGEVLMLRTTGGVNTHKGALFAFGLVTAAASHLLFQHEQIDAAELQALIRCLAAGFEQPHETHGAEVCKQYRVGGALENARAGYPALFADWLPYWQAHHEEPEAAHKLLLRIMASLDDTNVLHRAGAEAAAQVRQQAEALLNDFSLQKLEDLDREYIQRNISPGGAADLFALTRYIAGLCTPPVAE